ncbi:hypothetical protein TcasGA2_TC034985, partial [Tribolium castaneum]
LRSPFHGVYST